jgi:hypothetical protein
MAFVNLDGFGSLHFRNIVEDIVNPVAAIKAVTAQTQRTIAKAPSIVQKSLTPITKTLAQVQRTTSNPIMNVLNPIAMTKALKADPKTALMTGGVSAAMAISKSHTAGVLSPGQTAAADDQSIIYQDADGKTITKEQYDALMAQAEAEPEVVYQDANGNTITKQDYEHQVEMQHRESNPLYQAFAKFHGGTATTPATTAATTSAAPADTSADTYYDEKSNQITKAQYDAAMAQYQSQASASVAPTPSSAQVQQSYAPVQTQQATVADSSGDSAMQSAPVDVSSGDVLEQQVKAALLAIKNKAASGQALTTNEKDFVSFMAKATVQVGPMSGFGFLPIWQKNKFPELQITDTDEMLFSEPDDVYKMSDMPYQPSSDSELPSFHKNKVGDFSPRENFEGIGEWCKL